MYIPKPPAETLVDSFDYYPYQGQDDWGKDVYGEAVTVSRCRIDRTPLYTSNEAGKSLLYNAVIYCYEGLTSAHPLFTMQSKVVYDDTEHTITKAIPNKEPYKDEIYSYELEVV